MCGFFFPPFNALLVHFLHLQLCRQFNFFYVDGFFFKINCIFVEYLNVNVHTYIYIYPILFLIQTLSFPIEVPIYLPDTRSHLMVARWAEVRKVRNPAQALQSAASRPLRPKPWISCTNTPTSTRANRPRSARRCHTSESEERQRGKERGSVREKESGSENEKWIDPVRLPHRDSCSLTTTWATHLYLASTTCPMPQVRTSPTFSLGHAL